VKYLSIYKGSFMSINKRGFEFYKPEGERSPTEPVGGPDVDSAISSEGLVGGLPDTVGFQFPGPEYKQDEQCPELGAAAAVREKVDLENDHLVRFGVDQVGPSQS
jgi:hypothetical protein